MQVGIGMYAGICTCIYARTSREYSVCVHPMSACSHAMYIVYLVGTSWAFSSIVVQYGHTDQGVSLVHMAYLACSFSDDDY